MTNTIDQFMWAFQPHFRAGVQYEVQEVLSRIGLQTHRKVKVLLVGLANRDEMGHQTCIEPEDGPLNVGDLRSIEERTNKIIEADPEFQMFHSNPRLHQQRKRGLFLRSRAKAIAEAIQESAKLENLTFFASSSAPLAGYDIHTCIGIPSETLESVPTFSNPRKDDYHRRHIEESFVQSIINTCLQRADRALYLPYPGEGPSVLGNRIDIVRGSATRFVEGVTFALTPLPTDLFRFTNEVSSLTYERSGAKGHLVITNADNLANKLKVTLEKPVKLGEARIMRKMLELTNETTALLADGEAAYGLGECISAPDVARIVMDGHAKWSLSINNTTLMRVSYGHATLPKQILDKNLFRDIANRKLRTVNIERIWEVFQSAMDSNHGTTIVVSEDPISEVKRLGQEALAIKPEYLDHKEVARLGGIDGAIMLGADGRCYAFGVILDGLATATGDRARGARFNSSVRYQKTSKKGTIIIIISDDGTVDLVPSLMPRVSRHEVKDAVQAFCEYSGIQNNDGEKWARLNREVERLSFYLDQEQCDRVNAAYDAEMDSRIKAGGIKLMRTPLQPDPDMDDSYFKNETQR
ncbi:MAG: diadenylate cyclase [Chloroflexota bacterium]|nr:diadenylate cyclase [Chloroflexota bacterium]